MSFQAMVGTWLAAQLVTDMPVGARFGRPRARSLRRKLISGTYEFIFQRSGFDGGR